MTTARPPKPNARSTSRDASVAAVARRVVARRVVGSARILPRVATAGAIVAAACGVVTACSEEPTGTFTLTTGGEADALTRAPAPTTLVVEDLATDGTKTELARSSLPATSFGLGSKGRSDVGAIVVRALDAAGKELLHGETLFFQYGALADTGVDVFLQRNGEFARLPRPFANAVTADVVVRATDRYVVAATGTDTWLYDLLQLTAITKAPSLPRSARSLVAFGSTLLAIDEQGASAIDLSTNATREVAPPSSGGFADVAGGATVALVDGSSFVVGGTRTSGAPTSRVLHVAADGKLSFLDLITPRLGACAAWVEGRGLIVAGGSASGAGIERVDATSLAASALPFPSDDVVGCGMGALDDSHVLVAGGVRSAATSAPVAVVDLACAANCAPAAGAIPVPLVRAEGVAVASDAALVVGDDASGANFARRRARSPGFRRVPPRGAHLIAMPTGGAAVVGGAAEIEQYRE